MTDFSSISVATGNPMDKPLTRPASSKREIMDWYEKTKSLERKGVHNWTTDERNWVHNLPAFPATIRFHSRFGRALIRDDDLIHKMSLAYKKVWDMNTLL
jgi:hypothetical protein